MNRPKLTPAIIGSVIIFCLAAYGLLSLLGNSTQWIRPNPTFSPSPNVSSSLTPPYHYKESERFSSGERAFFNQSKEPKRDAGINAFKAGNYSEAVTLFKKAVEINANDPEVQIYLNNARARKAGSAPFTLAAVVPVVGQWNLAKEILRGVADGQTKFNEDLGRDGRLLEIAIANDNDDRVIAKEVANELTNNPSILGVIGHSSSTVSQAALLEYNNDLAIVSSTSTSTSLSKNNFFRTVPSDEATGKKLAEYTENLPELNKVKIFWNSNSKYSESLQEAFTKNFKKFPSKLVDLKDNKLDLNSEVSQSIINKTADTVLLLTDRNSTAIEVARSNAKFPKEQRLRLLGGDALYDPDILKDGISTEGLVLAIPWFDESQDYATKAKARWGGRVSWATATSFDATQALTKALSKNATRSSVLENLKSRKLESSETSGNIIDFSQTNSSLREPVLVRVVKGSGGPQGSQFTFELLK